MPIVFVCEEERYATEALSTVLSAFASWKTPTIGEVWSDDQLLKLNDHPTLSGVRHKLYVFLRPETGQKTITMDYKYGPFVRSVPECCMGNC